MVRAESGAAIKVVYLQQGTIAYASSNDRADRLTIIRRAGKLTQEQIEHAQERVKPGISLGKTLVELGFLTSKELLWGAKLQVEGIIHQLLFWKEGSYQVLQGPLQKEIVSLNLNVYQVVFSGIMKTNDRRWVLEQIGTPEAVYGLSEEFHLKNASYRLPIESVVSRINGKRTINEIAHSSAVDAFEVSKTIAALEILGMAKRPKERPIQMPLIAGKPSTVEKLPIPEEETHPTPEVSLGQVLQIPTMEQLQNESSENPAEVVPQGTELPESKAEEQLEARQEDLEQEPLSDEDMESNHVLFVPPHASDQSGFGIFGMSPHRSILLICAAVLLGILIFIFLYFLLNNNSETGHGNPSVQVSPASHCRSQNLGLPSIHRKSKLPRR